jgi:hypothetical protein
MMPQKRPSRRENIFPGRQTPEKRTFGPFAVIYGGTNRAEAIYALVGGAIA